MPNRRRREVRPPATWSALQAIALGPDDSPDPNNPRYFIQREISALAFNRRVLAQALDPETPLLERLRFLTICSTNLDEFFEIRVAGLKQLVAAGAAKPSPDAYSPGQALARIAAEAHELVAEQYRILNQVLLPALEGAGIRVIKRTAWLPAQQDWVRAFFLEQVLPVLTPLGLDPGHPFPAILNKSLNLVLSLDGTDAFGREHDVAVVKVPRCLPRVIPLPPEVSLGPSDFVLLSSVVHAHVDELFPGMKVRGAYQFRITRNADLWVDEEESEDLLDTLRGELPSRRYADAVRLEVADNCPPRAVSFLCQQVDLTDDDVYQVEGPVNLHRLGALYDLIDRPDLKYPPFVPGNPTRRAESMFEAMRQGDVLLHHPFEGFAPVVELVQQAAADPDVLAIKQTLYRTGSRSPIVEALIDAAQASKEVTVVIELRARFDEAANIDLATKLQSAGATVVYGIVGYKAHAKLLLVVRREQGKLVRYAHVGTGNYHSGNARAYTDFSLFTADPSVTADVHRVFLQLSSVGDLPRMERLLHSPFTLKRWLLERFRAEADAARAGQPAWIEARMNSLSDPEIVRGLYDASQAGVRIELIIRGICCLVPGVPGLSETIRVRSVVGRFLEHSRVYRFCAGGEDLVYLSSADWMPRNLDRRVEVATPVLDPALKARVIDEALGVYLTDNRRAWALGPDGQWHKVPADEPVRDAQLELLARLSGS